MSHEILIIGCHKVEELTNSWLFLVQVLCLARYDPFYLNPNCFDEIKFAVVRDRSFNKFVCANFAIDRRNVHICAGLSSGLIIVAHNSDFNTLFENVHFFNYSKFAFLRKKKCFF